MKNEELKDKKFDFNHSVISILREMYALNRTILDINVSLLSKLKEEDKDAIYKKANDLMDTYKALSDNLLVEIDNDGIIKS